MPSRPGLCPICNTMEKNLYNHNKSKHEDEFSLYFEGSGVVLVKRDSIIKKFKCRYCQSYYESQSSFKMHFKYKGQNCLHQYSHNIIPNKSHKKNNYSVQTVNPEQIQQIQQIQQQNNNQQQQQPDQNYNSNNQQNNQSSQNNQQKQYQEEEEEEEYNKKSQYSDYEDDDDEREDDRNNNIKHHGNGKQVDVACCTFDDMILIPAQDFSIPVSKKDILDKECLKIIIGKQTQSQSSSQSKKQFKSILSKCFKLNTLLDVYSWSVLSYEGSLTCQKSLFQEEPKIRYNVHFTVDSHAKIDLPKYWKVKLSFLDKEHSLLDSKSKL